MRTIILLSNISGYFRIRHQAGRQVQRYRYTDAGQAHAD
jgi:hypothetical protein